MNLSDDLYDCVYWKGEERCLSGKSFGLTISDIIPGNEQNTIQQIHAAATLNGKVTRLKAIYSSGDKININILEQSIRSRIKKCLGVKNDYSDENIRIWYYERGDAKLDIDNLPLRLAITIANIPQYASRLTETTLKNELYKVFWSWISLGVHGGGDFVQ